MPVKKAIRASMIPDARLVDALRVKLSFQPMNLTAISVMLAESPSSRPAEEDVLGALNYMIKLNEAKRVPNRGWCKNDSLFTGVTQ